MAETVPARLVKNTLNFSLNQLVNNPGIDHEAYFETLKRAEESINTDSENGNSTTEQQVAVILTRRFGQFIKNLEPRLSQFKEENPHLYPSTDGELVRENPIVTAARWIASKIKRQIDEPTSPNSTINAVEIH